MALPLAPIRLPFDPVFDALPGDSRSEKASFVARQRGISEMSAYQALLRHEHHGLAPAVADRWAVLALRHPLELWPQDLWNDAWDAIDVQHQRILRARHQRRLIAQRQRRRLKVAT